MVDDDDFTNGTILLSEEEQHVLCRRTVRGRLAPRGLLASIPRDAGPNARTVIRAIDIAVLRMAVNCGAIQVVRFGRKPVTPPSDPASIVDLVLSGAIFAASRLIPRTDPFSNEDDDR